MAFFEAGAASRVCLQGGTLVPERVWTSLWIARPPARGLSACASGPRSGGLL